MRQRRIVIKSIPLGWPERILAGVFAGLLLLLGLAFGAVLLGLSLIAGLALAARIWWLRRRLQRSGAEQVRTSVIEGEYRVLTQRQDHFEDRRK